MIFKGFDYLNNILNSTENDLYILLVNFHKNAHFFDSQEIFFFINLNLKNFILIDANKLFIHKN